MISTIKHKLNWERYKSTIRVHTTHHTTLRLIEEAMKGFSYHSLNDREIVLTYIAYLLSLFDFFSCDETGQNIEKTKGHEERLFDEILKLFEAKVLYA